MIREQFLAGADVVLAAVSDPRVAGAWEHESILAGQTIGSLGIEPWPNPPDAEAIVIACGAEIGRRRRGGAAMLRALYRGEAEPALPVL